MKKKFLKFNMAVILFFMILLAKFSFATMENVQTDNSNNNNTTTTQQVLNINKGAVKTINIQQVGSGDDKREEHFSVQKSGYYKITLYDEKSNVYKLDTHTGIIYEGEAHKDFFGATYYDDVREFYINSNSQYVFLEDKKDYYFILDSNKNYKIELEKLENGDKYDDNVLKDLAYPPDPELFEKAISFVIRTIGQGIEDIFGKISEMVKDPLSIDKLVFDRYNIITLAFYDKDIESGYYDIDGVKGEKNSLVKDSYEPLNYVFNTFRNIAIVAYLVILVYMGLRILIMTASPTKKAKYKELMFDWIKGIIILFFFPYIIRYTMLLNHAFVTFIYDKTPNKEEIAGATIQSNLIAQNTEDKSEVVAKQDYMAKMREDAFKNFRIVDAICWVVMLIQVGQFLILYLKRLVTIIFLIAIFPLVTISYAVDKIGDGKSQAFNNWYKEFVLQVFIQSFHAMNYVIVMGILLGNSTNWLLKIIGVGYIAKGGDILKGMFSQMKGGAGGATGTMEVAKAYMRTKLTLEGINSIRTSVVNAFGSNSLAGRGIRHIRNVRDEAEYNKMLEVEKNSNKTIRLNKIRENAENAANNAKKVRKLSELDDLEAKKATLSGSSNPRDIDELAKIEDRIKKLREDYKKSIDELVPLSAEEFDKAVKDAGLSGEQIEQLRHALSHASAISIIRHRKHERNVDIRTAVDVIMSDRKIPTGNRFLDEYVESTRNDDDISDKALHRIKVANSITIDEAAASASPRPARPTGTADRLRYSMERLKNAVDGESGIIELHEDVDFIKSLRGNAAYDAIISEGENDMGFTVDDFELNLHVQTINHSNDADFVINPEAQKLVDNAIDAVKTAKSINKGQETLKGIHADIDSLEKGYIPVLKEKENERSILQEKVAQKMKSETQLLGMRGEEYEEYLDDMISENRREIIGHKVKGATELAAGVVAGTARATTTTASTGILTGTTYSMNSDSSPIIYTVSSTMKVADGVSNAIRNAISTDSNSKINMNKASVDINRKGYFADTAREQEVNRELQKYENVRKKLKGRKS